MCYTCRISEERNGSESNMANSVRFMGYYYFYFYFYPEKVRAICDAQNRKEDGSRFR